MKLKLRELSAAFYNETYKGEYDQNQRRYEQEKIFYNIAAVMRSSPFAVAGTFAKEAYHE